MARIIVHHFSTAARVPKLTTHECTGIRWRYDEVLRNYPGVRFDGVYVDDEGKGICEWEAPSVAVVNEIITKVDGHPPIDGAVAVRKIL